MSADASARGAAGDDDPGATAPAGSARKRGPSPGDAGEGTGAAGADTPGLAFSPESGLVRRALEEVASGPTAPEVLAREVLGIRSAPPEVTRRVVDELLGGHHGVELEDGRWRLRERAGDARLEDMDYVVVDLETTGASPGRGHRVTEVAAMEVRRGEITDEFSTLVDPGRPIPPAISELTGITDEMVADAPAFEEVSGLVRERLEGRVFVAHNVPFDWRFLTGEMRRAGAPLPRGPRLCTLRLARRALPDLPRKGLDAVARHYGVEIEGRHRAAGDALATASVLRRLMGEARELGVRRWQELEHWLSGGPPPGRREDGERC